MDLETCLSDLPRLDRLAYNEIDKTMESLTIFWAENLGKFPAVTLISGLFHCFYDPISSSCQGG